LQQHTKIAQVRRNIRNEVVEPQKYDLGNNFIRKGSGLARTPPRRPDGTQSNSDSPIDGAPSIQVSRTGYKEAAVEEDLTPISWPSRAENPVKQSPLTAPNLFGETPQSAKANRNLPGLADRVLEQHGQVQGKQSSPPRMVPRQIKSPRGPIPQQQVPIGISGMPQIAIPPGIGGDPH